MTKNNNNCYFILAITLIVIAPIVTSDDATPIPADKGKLDGWMTDNIKPLADRKDLDPDLVAAEATPKIIKVGKVGKADFTNIKDAVKSVATDNKQRVIIVIEAGEYNEKVTIERTKPYVTLFGDPNGQTNLTFGGTAAEFGTVNSASLIVEADYFVAVNMGFKNSAPKPDGKRQGAQAVAVRASGTKQAYYNCKFYGFQDTLCDDKGLHFFHNCYIEGTVDYIFGSGRSLYVNTEIRAIDDPGFRVITAQAKKDPAEKDTGYSFVHCNVTGEWTDGNPGIYLGRAWMQAPEVVFSFTAMSKVVNPIAWSTDFHPDRESTVNYGEYQSSGPGSNSPERAKFLKVLKDDQAAPFISLGYIGGSKWLLPPPKV